MSKFNRTAVRPAGGRGPVVTEQVPTLRTFNGAPAYARDAKSDLFLLAVTNMVGEDTFYESAGDRDARYVQLVRQVAVEDPVWLVQMLRWLRGPSANMRSASLVGAAEMVRARLEAGAPSVPAYEVPGFSDDRGVDRAVVDVVCQRADEPGELLAYWTLRYGRALPKPVKRGLGDAVRRLYNEYGLLKYDTGSHGFRFADVVDLCHPTPVAAWQGQLFRYALDRRHNRVGEVPDELAMVHANVALRRDAAERPAALLDTARLFAAGMTWEDVLSAGGPLLSKSAMWSALIPVMGIFALARNLRNFDQAGVPDAAIAPALARFADPAQVAKSRMLPFRWLAAYEQAPSLRWGHALEQALQASLRSVPAFAGRTLVLVDTSGSMQSKMSGKSTMQRVKAAALFGVALAAAGGDVELRGFADGRNVFRHDVPKGGSVLRETARLAARVGEDGHGTNIAGALRVAYAGHDRVIILTDMQTGPVMDAYVRDGGIYGVANAIPDRVPMYGFNLAGYAPTALPATGTRVELGGLSDATFRLIPLLEAGRRADWDAVFAS